MNSPRNDFKPSAVYDWAAEPKDERPSEFAASTGYQLHSGFYAAPVVTARRRQNSAPMWLAVGILAGLALVGLLVLIKVLRG
jgi:hypothetical protein